MVQIRWQNTHNAIHFVFIGGRFSLPSHLETGYVGRERAACQKGGRNGREVGTVQTHWQEHQISPASAFAPFLPSHHLTHPGMQQQPTCWEVSMVSPPQPASHFHFVLNNVSVQKECLKWHHLNMRTEWNIWAFLVFLLVGLWELIMAWTTFLITTPYHHHPPPTECWKVNFGERKGTT